MSITHITQFLVGFQIIWKKPVEISIAVAISCKRFCLNMFFQRLNWPYNCVVVGEIKAVEQESFPTYNFTGKVDSEKL